jgi:ribose/xylose/arabinose/galactoside ABC-type transport system permease subunit
MNLYFLKIMFELDFEILVNFIVNYITTNFNLDNLIVTLSNLEYLQYLVGVPQNGYDINNPNLFFEMLLQSQDLSVELVDEVYLNVINVNNVIYTVHPDLIQFLLNLFIELEEVLFF